MIALIQRVQHAHVSVKDIEIATIGQGLLAFIGIEREDTNLQADILIKRLLNYRIFSDENDKMNRSLRDISGGLLLVPQFTLAADTSTGLRPSFTLAAPPDLGLQLFNYFCQQATQLHHQVQLGEFGADMQVSLTNDGPVTFWLQTK
jgi:D-tyrosyl-tRNA(Tyr) deacylase